MRNLTQADYDLVRQLRNGGMKIKDIARQVGCCEATVSNITNNENRVPKAKKSVVPPHENDKEVQAEYEDFSKLPATVLFRHVRIWDFIG